jgi:hypothetical protein
MIDPFSVWIDFYQIVGGGGGCCMTGMVRGGRGDGMRQSEWGEGCSVFIWIDIHKPVENDLNPSIRNYLLISMVKGYLSIHMAKV